MTPRFLFPTLPLPTTACASDEAALTVALDEATAHHARNVLRLSVGDAIELFDGQGNSAGATVQHVDKRTVLITISGPWRTQALAPLVLHVGLALLQGDKMDWAIEKLVELGVVTITVIAAHRSKVKLDGDRAVRRIEHWRHIAQAAAAQCGRNDLPQVYGIVPSKIWWPRRRNHADGASSTPTKASPPQASHALRLLLDPEATWSLAQTLQGHALLTPELGIDAIRPPIHGDQANSPTSQTRAIAEPRPEILIATGPESGWTEEECAAARQDGWQTVKFGPRVLRAETAPIAVCAAIQALSGDLR